jgi:hypothetical protein
MKNYLLFFGKSSDFTTYAFNESGLVKDFNKNIFKDFDLLETRFLVNDQLDNKIALAKYNFEYNGLKYSMLKIYGCAMAMNSDRISGSSYGVAFISELEISLSKENINLLNSVRLKFKELVIENNRFVETSFLHFVEQIWSVFNESNYFRKIQAIGTPIVSANSTPRSFHIENFDDLEIVGSDQIKFSSKIYFTTDLEHLQRSIKYVGGNVPLFTISKGKVTKFKDIIEKASHENINQRANNNPADSTLELELKSLKKEKTELQFQRNKLVKYQYAFWINSLFFIGLITYSFFYYNNIISKLESRIKSYQAQEIKDKGKKLLPFIDKDNNISKDKFVNKIGDTIPEYIMDRNGKIRKLTTEEKNKFK